MLVPFMLICCSGGDPGRRGPEAATNCLGPASTGGGDRLAPLGSFIKPVDPSTVTLTSGFGARWGEEHKGIDLAGDIGTPIYAAADGTVRNAGEASGFGQWVVLDTSGGQLVATVYGQHRHLQRRGRTAGPGASADATIGNRGQSTGPHLHWEVWPGGWGTTAVDPQPYYDSAPAPGAPTTGGRPLYRRRRRRLSQPTCRSRSPVGRFRADMQVDTRS
ncbi:peptidoglycan DD-metalloendopeptidase family protein [Rhodococcus hoagii]|nr:peptidoglycan DD-metalloendopeptidase family protein [Prescottella equi]